MDFITVNQIHGEDICKRTLNINQIVSFYDTEDLTKICMTNGDVIWVRPQISSKIRTYLNSTGNKVGTVGE